MKWYQKRNNMYTFKKKSSKPATIDPPKKGTSLLSKLVKDTDNNSDSEKTVESLYDELDLITKKSPVKTLKKIDKKSQNKSKSESDSESDSESSLDSEITKTKSIKNITQPIVNNKGNNDTIKNVDKNMDKKKLCRKCNIEKSITEFSKHSGTADKLDNRCKHCVKEVKTKLKTKIIDENDGKTTRDIVRSASEYKDFFEPDDSHTDWQGGKILGSKYIRTGDTKYTVRYNGKYKVVGTEKEANDYLIQQNILNDTCKNRYKIVPYKNKKYIIMQLGENYVSLFSYQDLDYLRKVNIFRTKSSTNINSKYYVGVTINYINKLIHNVLTNFDMCDHMNRCPLDNRRENISLTDHSDNNKNKSCISYKRIKTENDKIVAKIKWTDNTKGGFKQMNEKKEFDEMNDAKLWIDERCEQLEEINKKTMDSDFLELKNEFVEIMLKYAPEYKYLDDVIFEEVINKIIIKESDDNKKKELKKLKLDDTTEKLDKASKYDLFKNIDKDFTLNKYNINIKNNMVQHISYDNIEYKFCGHCIKWLNINNFGISSSTPDKFSKTCKECKNGNKEHLREIKRAWALKNKEKLSAYNKAYNMEHKKTEAIDI
jgi:hypothetical protein